MASSFSRRTLLRTGLGASAALAMPHAVLATPPAKSKPHMRRPNILLIVADDLSKDGLGVYSRAMFRTPTLNRLAREGMTFTRFYVNPLCSPTRGEILTGLYPVTSGWTTNRGNEETLDPDLGTVAQLLQSAGYLTAIAGKWHVGRLGAHPDHPVKMGFDHHALTFPTFGKLWGQSYLENGVLKKLSGKIFLPRVQTAWLADFIRNSASPWFAVMSHNLVHTPWVPTPSTLGKPWDTNDPRWFAGMVEEMDYLTGLLVDAVDENTLVVFTTDNGRTRKIGGDKGGMKEGSICVPFIARWPGIVSAESRYHGLHEAADILPTFTELANMPVPASDGISMLPALQGGNTVKPWVLCQHDRGWTVVENDWKLTSNGKLWSLRYFDDCGFECRPIDGHAWKRDALAQIAFGLGL